MASLWSLQDLSQLDMTNHVDIVNTATEKYVTWTVQYPGEECSKTFTVPFAQNLKAFIVIQQPNVCLVIEPSPPLEFKFQLMVKRGNAFEAMPMKRASFVEFSSKIDLKEARDANGLLTFMLTENDFPRRQREVLIKFFEEEAFTDFTFVVEGKEIKVSKLILATHSDVFRKMFETNIEEKKQGTVEIADISYAGFRSLVKFIYSNKLEPKDLDGDILVAADKYNVVDVKKAYTELKLQMLRNDNADEIMLLAHKHNLQELLEKCFEVMKTDKENQELIKKLLTRCNRNV